jgi:hypothetical protein
MKEVKRELKVRTQEKKKPKRKQKNKRDSEKILCNFFLFGVSEVRVYIMRKIVPFVIKVSPFLDLFFFTFIRE